MRIAIIGIGAMGLVYAGLLADAGLDVWGVDTRVGEANLVIIATKAAGVASAAEAAKKILADSGIILTIQNGLGSADQVADLVGPDADDVEQQGMSCWRTGHLHFAADSTRYDFVCGFRCA